MQIYLGLFLGAAIAFLAYRLHALSRSGAVAAALLGTIVYGLGGLEWAILLIAFFGSSSVLTRFFSKRKQDLSATFSKGGQRDAMQVLANGGLAGGFVVIHALLPAESWPWLAYAATLAAVNADTWATELGVLSPSLPRKLSDFQPVARGTSGGVTAVGTLAAAGGALWIAVFAAVLWPAGIARTSGPGFTFVLVVTLAGLAGSLVDSLLGATLQAIYYCPACQRETERHPLHTCGTPTALVRGVSWLGNDGVNLACALTGGLLALLRMVF